MALYGQDFITQKNLRVTVSEATNILRTLISFWYTSVIFQRTKKKENDKILTMSPLVNLMGPPGVGKTSIVQEVTQEVGVLLIHLIPLTATVIVTEDIQMPVSQRLSLAELAEKATAALGNLKDYFTRLIEQLGNQPNIIRFVQFIVEKLQDAETTMQNPQLDVASKSAWLRQEHQDTLAALFEFYNIIKTYNIPPVGGAISTPEKYLEMVFALGDFMALNLTQFKFQLTGTLGKLQAAQQPFVLFIDEVGYNVNVVNSFLAALTHGVFSDMKLPPFFAIVASNIPEKEGAQVPLPPFIARATVLYVTQEVEGLYRYSEEVTLLTHYDAAAASCRGFKRDLTNPEEVLVPPRHFELLTSPDAAPVRESIIQAIDEYLQAWRRKEVEKLYPLLIKLEDTIDAGIRQLQPDPNNPIAYDGILPTSALALLETINRIKNMQTERILGRMRDPQLTFVKRVAAKLGMLRHTDPQDAERGEVALGKIYHRVLSIAQDLKHIIVEQLRTSTNPVFSSAAEYLESGQPIMLHGELVVAPSPRAIIDYYTYVVAATLYRLVTNTILEHIENALREGKPQLNVVNIIQEVAEKLHRQTPPPPRIRGGASFKREDIPPEIRALFYITTGMVGEKLAREMLATTIEYLTTHIFPREQITHSAKDIVESAINLYNFSVEDPSQQVGGRAEGKIDIRETFTSLVERSLNNFLQNREQVIQYLNTNFANASTAQSTLDRITSTIQSIVDKVIAPEELSEETEGAEAAKEEIVAQEIENILRNLNNQRDYLGIIIAAIVIVHRLANPQQQGKKRKGSVSPLESAKGIIREIAEMTQHQFANIITTCVNYASDAITSDPHNENHQRLAVSLTNFLNMLLVLPSKGEALKWVINTPNIRGLLASWLALLYSVGLATAVTETPTDIASGRRMRGRDIAETIKQYYTIEDATGGEVGKIMETIGRNIEMAANILAHAINNPTDIVRVMIEPQSAGEPAQKFAQLMQAKLPQILQNPYLATVAKYVFYPAISNWGLEEEGVDIDPNELRQKFDPQKVGAFVSDWVAQTQIKLFTDLLRPTAIAHQTVWKKGDDDVAALMSSGVALLPIALLSEDKQDDARELLHKLAPLWEQSKERMVIDYIKEAAGIDLHDITLE